MKRQLFEQRQKLQYVQQQQKRLLIQQKQQQLSLNTRQTIPDNIPNLQSPATNPFPEGMNDLLNNTVAPNVTLQVCIPGIYEIFYVVGIEMIKI